MRAHLTRRSAVALGGCVLLASPFAFAQGQEKALGAAFDFLFQLLLLGAGCIVTLVLIAVAFPGRKLVLMLCVVVGGALTVGGVKSALTFDSWSSLSAGGIADMQVLASGAACVIGMSAVGIALVRLAPRRG